MDSHQVDILPFDSLVKIEISGTFYQRLQNCLVKTLQEKEHKPEELVQIMKELETRQPVNDWEERLYLFMALIYEVNEQGEKQNVIVKKSVDLPSTTESPGASPES